MEDGQRSLSKKLRSHGVWLGELRGGRRLMAQEATICTEGAARWEGD